jgi:L-ribulose-5-phosphate 3-epimerase/hexulose-6-phosphate isomerase
MPGTLSLEQKLGETRKAEFDYLELSIDETDEKLARLQWGGTGIISLHRSIEESGIPIRSICLSAHRRFPLGDLDPEIGRRSLAIMEGAITLASRLGVRLIQIAGYDVYYKPSDERTRIAFAENLERSVSMASREGVILAFETMETPFIDTVEKAMFWVNRFRSPYLQVYPDIGNITNAALLYNSPVAADLEQGTGHIAALHLKETKPGVYRELPYGEGHVDFPGAVTTARRLGVRLFVGEFWHTGGGNWREMLKKNNRFLRKILDPAFHP